MKQITMILLFVLVNNVSVGQPLASYPEHNIYDADRPPPSFFKANRQKLLSSLGDSSVVILYAASIHERNNDVDFKFRQDDDFYYLTGCNEPNAMVILSSRELEVKDSTGKHMVREILFVDPRDSSSESWTGRRLGPSGAMKVLGFEYALTNKEFQQYFRRAAYRAKSVYLPITPSDVSGEIASVVREIESTARQLQRSKELRNPIRTIRMMREAKTPEELVLMKKAAEVSMEGHRQMMRVCRPGMFEYQLQAAFENAITSGGAEYTAYPCIVGSGENSVILHYETNRRQLRDGDVIVMDCGAEYHNYAADITRTIPVSGTFTKAQRKIYSIVLKAQNECMKLVKPGVNYYATVNKKAGEVIRDGLLGLGIIKDSSDYEKFFTHGVGHPVGLDVHDVSIDGVLRPGQVWTVEPGIYIPANADGVDPQYRNIGVRIEDEVLVTAGGYVNLTSALPRETDEIEQLMKEGRSKRK